MKTIELKIYSFNELSENAKQKAIKDFSEDYSREFYFSDDYVGTINKFCEFTGIKTSHRDLFYPDLGSIQDDIMGLYGVRLRTWILNNWEWFLFKRKYLGHSTCGLDVSCNPLKHKMKKFGTNYKGNLYCSYHSNIQVSNECVLTGVCTDNSILNPIYEFIKKPDLSTNFEGLIKLCFDEISEAYRKEQDYFWSEEYAEEELLISDYEFLETGERY